MKKYEITILCSQGVIKYTFFENQANQVEKELTEKYGNFIQLQFKEI